MPGHNGVTLGEAKFAALNNKTPETSSWLVEPEFEAEVGAGAILDSWELG